MLLRNSISNTKKFFRKTLQSFKSFFTSCEPYHKLPKTTSYINPYSFSATTSGFDDHDIHMNPQTSSYHDHLETSYTNFDDRWDVVVSDNGKAKKRNQKKTNLSSWPTAEQRTQRTEEMNDRSKQQRSGVATAKVGKRPQQEDCCLYSKSKRESVAKKLKDIEMMDLSNVDHVLDIEEVLHYYSRLTCPAYLDIVDKFFTDMYTEFLGPSASPRSVNSRPKFRSVRA